MTATWGSSSLEARRRRVSSSPCERPRRPSTSSSVPPNRGGAGKRAGPAGVWRRLGRCCVLKTGPDPAGGSPVRVIAGEPGSRPRSVVERWRAERGVKSLFGGSKRAGRSATRRESCSLVRTTTGEPSRSFHGEGPPPTYWPVPEMPLVGSLSGYGERHVRKGLVRDRRGPSAQPRQQRPLV